ncbi:hypothetical protein BJ742DRAFT_816562 [Cladochytrium replicatum]|nr:hypothetical protein BJ742DRAFT_816562 [Cladochytrium replicatum]
MFHSPTAAMFHGMILSLAICSLSISIFAGAMPVHLHERAGDLESDPLAALTAFFGVGDELEALYRLALAERAILPEDAPVSSYLILPHLEDSATRLYNRFDSNSAPIEDYINFNSWVLSADPADVETEYGFGIKVRKYLSGGGDGTVVETPSRQFQMTSVQTVNETSALGNLRITFGTIPLSNTTLDGSDAVEA